MSNDELRGKRYFTYTEGSFLNMNNQKFETILQVKLTYYNENDKS